MKRILFRTRKVLIFSASILLVIFFASGARAEASPAAGAEAALIAAIERLAGAETEPWARAIYGAGMKNLEIETGEDGSATARFSLRSFDPKSLADAEDWTALRERASGYDLSLSLSLRPAESGYALSDAEEKALRAAVRTAAAAARQNFDRRALRVALADYLFPKSPEAAAARAEALFPELAEGADIIAALLSRGEGKSLDVSEGPNSLTLRFSLDDPARLSERARASCEETLSKIAYANKKTRDELRAALLESVCAASGEPIEAERALDLDDPGKGLGALAEAQLRAFYDALDALQVSVAAMPDIPLPDRPASGPLSGGEAGVSVGFAAPGAAMDRYLRVMSAENKSQAAEVYLRAGETASLRLPLGRYYLLIAKGETWHGAQALFGGEISFSRMDGIDVWADNQILLFTLPAGSEKGPEPSALTPEPSP